MIAEHEGRVLDRREFSRESLLLLFGGLSITVTGCSGGGSSPMAATPTAAGQPASGIADVRGTVAGNHGHVALLTGMQISAAGAVSITIRGAADHDHQLALSAAEVARLRDGQAVAVRSAAGTDGHDHMVTFSRSSDGPTGPTYE